LVQHQIIVLKYMNSGIQKQNADAKPETPYF
jgi:hypothetical protein